MMLSFGFGAAHTHMRLFWVVTGDRGHLGGRLENDYSSDV